MREVDEKQEISLLWPKIIFVLYVAEQEKKTLLYSEIYSFDCFTSSYLISFIQN